MPFDGLFHNKSLMASPNDVFHDKYMTAKASTNNIFMSSVPLRGNQENWSLKRSSLFHVKQDTIWL